VSALTDLSNNTKDKREEESNKEKTLDIQTTIEIFLGVGVKT
jgi:hypothetical protein